jgi:bifunctional DNA-binding transcriptional regulator/antitoxin component of YhaV-PrlF toxin-antitoxin module
MPQLVKGGKHVFGWSKVNSNGRIVVPKEAWTEYSFENVNKVILMTASKTSGGFVITTPSLLKNSKLSVILDKEPQLAELQLPEAETVKVGTRTYCWVKLNSDGGFIVPSGTLEQYGVKTGDQLLVVRGSWVGLSFLVKGPIIEEAKKHIELLVFE